MILLDTDELKNIIKIPFNNQNDDKYLFILFMEYFIKFIE